MPASLVRMTRETLNGSEYDNFMATHSSLAFYAKFTSFGLPMPYFWFFLSLTMPFHCDFCFALLCDIAKIYALAFVFSLLRCLFLRSFFCLSFDSNPLALSCSRNPVPCVVQHSFFILTINANRSVLLVR